MAQQKSQVWDDISSCTFTVASVDNFDMLKSHAAVYCGDQQRSYHGTTLQLVQPDPSSVFLSNTSSTVDQSSWLELTTTTNALSTDQPSESSNSKPKRKRTVYVENLKSTLSTPLTSKVRMITCT